MVESVPVVLKQGLKKDEAEKRIVEMLGEYHDSERKAEVIEVYRKAK